MAEHSQIKTFDVPVQRVWAVRVRPEQLGQVAADGSAVRPRGVGSRWSLLANRTVTITTSPRRYGRTTPPRGCPVVAGRHGVRKLAGDPGRERSHRAGEVERGMAEALEALAALAR